MPNDWRLNVLIAAFARPLINGRYKWKIWKTRAAGQRPSSLGGPKRSKYESRVSRFVGRRTKASISLVCRLLSLLLASCRSLSLLVARCRLLSHVVAYRRLSSLTVAHLADDGTTGGNARGWVDKGAMRNMDDVPMHTRTRSPGVRPDARPEARQVRRRDRGPAARLPRQRPHGPLRAVVRVAGAGRAELAGPEVPTPTHKVPDHAGGAGSRSTAAAPTGSAA
jgi:hypothetical protein